MTVGLRNLSPAELGNQYPMHIHPGLTCDGVNVPIVHDLGAPQSVMSAAQYPQASVGEALLPPGHLVAGYYFDVHAPDDPTGRPLGCALF